MKRAESFSEARALTREESGFARRDEGEGSRRHSSSVGSVSRLLETNVHVSRDLLHVGD